MLREKANAEQADQALRTANNTIADAAEDIGASVDITKLSNINRAFVSNPQNVITDQFVSYYADVFTDAMEQGGKLGYKQLSTKTDNLSGALTNAVMGRPVDTELLSEPNTRQAFSAVLNGFQRFLQKGVSVNQRLHNMLFEENPALTEQANRIENGDFRAILPRIQTVGVANSSGNGIIGNSEIVYSEKGRGGNGVNNFGTTVENNRGYGQVQGDGSRGAEIAPGSNSGFDTGSTAERIPGGRNPEVETGTLEELYQKQAFRKLVEYVGREISRPLLSQLGRRYENDNRFDYDYDFIDIAVYDMLTGRNPELAELFQDQIYAYFQTEQLPDTDSTGRTVSEDILRRTADSVVRNDAGQLIPVYHATAADFSVFQPGDIGIHFGSRAQAIQRAKDKGITGTARLIRAYLNITNPIVLQEDTFGWNARQIAQMLERNNILTHEEALQFSDGGAEQNIALRALLQQKGYDGIIYENNFESVAGKSYIVFDDAQVLQNEQGNTGGYDGQVLKDVSAYDRRRWTSEPDGDESASSETGAEEQLGKKEQKIANRMNGISDIVSFLSEKFNIPVSTGNIRQRNVNGIYKNKAETIRVQVTNSLPTIAHELGHHLDNKYRLRKSVYIREAIQHADQEFLGMYRESEQPHEAVAEFVREYLRDRAAARRDMPQFFAEFENTLSETDLQNLKIAAEATNRYMSGSYGERVDAAIKTDGKKERRTLSELMDDLKTAYIDAYSP